MGLEIVRMRIWWQGYPGLKFVNLEEKLSNLKQIETALKYLVIHCGGIGVIDLPLHKINYHCL